MSKRSEQLVEVGMFLLLVLTLGASPAAYVNRWIDTLAQIYHKCLCPVPSHSSVICFSDTYHILLKINVKKFKPIVFEELHL